MSHTSNAQPERLAKTETRPRVQYAIAATLAVVTLLSFIGGRYPADQPLHHIPTALVIVALLIGAQRRLWSDASVAATAAFFLLHVLGARYIYSNVPYEAWLNAMFGITLADTFGFTRNHYDRVVHLGFGLFITVPIFEALRRLVARPGAPAPKYGYAWCFAIAVAVSIGGSALYELFEWGLAVGMAGEAADRYLGQQGDIWDAHKDMALATGGAILTAGVLALRRWDGGRRT